MKPVFMVIVCAVYGLSLGFAQTEKQITPFDASTYFIGDAKPVKSDLTGNPLDYAGKRIGLSVRGVELPRGWEGSYRFACRFPIIDYVSNRPLYLKQWAEDNASFINRSHRENGIRAIGAGLEILRGTAQYPGISGQANTSAVAEFQKSLSQSNFTPRYQKLVLALAKSFLKAKDLTTQAKKNLTREDLDFFNANPGYFLCPDGKRMFPITGNVDPQFQWIERARRVGYEYIFYAAKMMAQSIGDYVAATKDFKITDFYADSAKADEIFKIKTEAGVFVIAGMGNDTHSEDANFIIDLGGDDSYTNNAGGCDSAADGIALALDHAGDDRYSAPGKRYVQGFGFLGAGFLVDLAGDDEYVAGHFGQGAGIMGVGALWDKAGDDTYDAQTFCQGAGMFGLGMLLDGSGEDFYGCASLGQGGATTLGLGVLSDLEGDDRYELAVGKDRDPLDGIPGYGQGGALSCRQYPWEGKLTAYGGVGMLLDDRGNDRYRTQGWCDQGGSYIMSLGVLVDSEGNDHYSAGTGQGSGIHITNAILIDKDGNDIYEGGFRTGGSGGDRSPGFLIDYQGNDIYKSNTSSYGTGCKPFCFSLFIDYKGDDRYICPEPKDKITSNNWDSFGGVWPESDPYLWPYAICLDLGGNDDYRVRNRENNTERQSFGHGIQLDTEWKGGDVIGPVENPLEPYAAFPLPDAVKKSGYYRDIQLLQNPDCFVRFQAVGRITHAPVDCVEVLAQAILSSSHRQFNRDVLECIHSFFAAKQITEKEIPALVKLLQARDTEVRTIMADNFRIWKNSSAETGLIAALDDTTASVRRFALSALARLSTVNALVKAAWLAVDDPSEDVRRTAVRFVTRVRDEVDPFPLLAQILKDDSSSTVRVAAAEGIGFLQDRRGVEILERAAQSGDVYLERAAGKALAEFGEVSGIETLIRSLSFPSIDAFYNYDYNVPNFIAGYSGFDLPDDKRYEQAQWQEWFAENKNDIDIKANAQAFRRLTQLSDSLRGTTQEEQIQKYEEFLKEFPTHARVKKTLAGILNEVAWKKVTAPKDGKDFDPEKGLAYARRAVELAPDPGYFDTLAEALEANGNKDEAIKLCREMLKKYPGERMFSDRLERLTKK